MSCKICGSFAVNEHLYGRERGTDTDLCDVHYWMKRAEATQAAQVQANQQATEGKGVCMREEFETAMTANVVMPRPHLVPHLLTMFNRHPTGEYVQMWVDSAWIGWQAATALQAERVRELEEVGKGLVNLCKLSDADWTAAHSNEMHRLEQALSATAREVGE